MSTLLSSPRRELAAVATTAYEAVSALPSPLREAAAHHFGWPSQGVGTPRHSPSLPGKLMRARLCLLSAALVGGERATAVPQAASVELTHNFTLVLDDIMDHDPVRRGRAAVWSRFGPNSAMLLGVELYAVAIELLAQNSGAAAVRLLVDAGHTLCGGQCEDLDMAAADHVRSDIARWTAMAEAKTGALFGCAMALGGLAGSVDSSVEGGLDRAGRCVGIAFQIIDDLLRAWGDESFLGKPVVPDAAGNLYPPLAGLLADPSGKRPGIDHALAVVRSPVADLLDEAISLTTDVGVDRAAIAEFVDLVTDVAGRVR